MWSTKNSTSKTWINNSQPLENKRWIRPKSTLKWDSQHHKTKTHVGWEWQAYQRSSKGDPFSFLNWQRSNWVWGKWYISVEVKRKKSRKRRERESEQKNKRWVWNVDCHGPIPALIPSLRISWVKKDECKSKNEII